MTKTKKLFLFAATFLFLNVFFLRIDALNNDAKAFDCYDLCADEADPDSCFTQCEGSSNYSEPYIETNNGGVTQADCDAYGYNMTVNSAGTDCIADRSGGNSLNGVTQADCDAYGYGMIVNSAGTDCIANRSGGAADGGVTQADCDAYGYGMVVNADRTNCIADRSGGTANACYNVFDTAECCSSNGGYWYNSTCNTDQNTGKVGNSCGSDSDCGNGYKCDSSNTCMADGFFSATECRTDGDCQAGYGAGYVCSGFIVKTCERSTSASKTNPIAETTKAITLKNGSVAPMGTIVNSDGSGTSPSGQTYPAGSFQPPSSGGSNDNYSPFVLGSNYGSGGTNTPKCGANFQDIGGVCFPTNTNLSNAPIYVILSNIFSWLMGLFTTFAVLAFVIAGVQYLLASGDESMAKSAKTNAVYAIIGIIVGLSGFIIIKAIAAALSGQSILF